MRYFCFVGSVLVALLLVVNRILPAGELHPANSQAENYEIRIQSIAKLPDPIIFDTAQPAAAPPQSSTTEPSPQPREAFAQAPPAQPTALTSDHKAETSRPPKKYRSKVAALHRVAQTIKLASATQIARRPDNTISLAEELKERLGRVFKMN
jgi:hypothetical protein